MSTKPKSQTQTYPNKQPTNPRPWPDFPKQLLSTIGKQSYLMKNISFGGVAKSWRLSIKHCNPAGKATLPQLYENGDGNKYQINSTSLDKFNISFHYGCLWWFSRTHPSQDPFLHFEACIVGQSHGLTIMRSVDKPCEYHLRDPVSRCTRFLPDWDNNIPFKQIAFSSDPNNCSYCVVLVVTGIQHPALVFCDYYGGKYEWSKKVYDITDPYSASDKKLMQFTSVIGYEGIFYALSLQGTLAVIEVSDSKLRITRLGSSRAVPNVPSMHFKEYLTQSEGKILLLFLISRKSINLVDDVEIYQLEFERLSWVKRAGLGDRTLFVGKNCCIFVDACKVGCKANCVYFTHQRNNDVWWVYDMERENIVPGWEPADSLTKSPLWDEPTAED